MMTKMPQTANRVYIAQTRQLFHCHCKIKIPMAYGEALLDECFALMEAVDNRYNSYQSGSYFHRINRQAGDWVETDEVTVSLLKTLIGVSALTDGTYDITAMPLIRLWGFYDESPMSVPSDVSTRKALELVDYRQIEISGNAVKIAPQQEIITGSFIKAFAVDEVVKKLKNEGVTDAIVNAGGSTIYALADGTHPSWKVNIPSEAHGQQISIANQCFSLSARAANYIEIAGKRYGHILNAKTGRPSDTVQVGVISKDAFEGDVLSTALFAVEESELEKTVEQLKTRFDFEYFRNE